MQCAHDIGQLRVALVAYAAFGVSSSGVEQQFSKAALKFTDRMHRCSANNEEAFLRVADQYIEKRRKDMPNIQDDHPDPERN